MLFLFASFGVLVQSRSLGSKKLNSLIDSTGLSHKFTVDKVLGWAVQLNRCGTSWGLTPQSGHLGSTVDIRRFWYEFRSRLCPERRWDRVVLCGLISVSSSELIGGGRLHKNFTIIISPKEHNMSITSELAQILYLLRWAYPKDQSWDHYYF